VLVPSDAFPSHRTGSPSCRRPAHRAGGRIFAWVRGTRRVRHPAGCRRGGVAEVAVSWWVWPVLVVAAIVLVTGLFLWVQARRRSGTVITVRRERGPGERGVR
jgi:hypothetical protein